MGRGRSKSNGQGVKIPWVGMSKYHEWGDRYTMDRGFDIPWVGVKIPWVGGLIYHG